MEDVEIAVASPFGDRRRGVGDQGTLASFEELDFGDPIARITACRVREALLLIVQRHPLPAVFRALDLAYKFGIVGACKQPD